jgi:hypothetical protein
MMVYFVFRFFLKFDIVAGIAQVLQLQSGYNWIKLEILTAVVMKSTYYILWYNTV